MSCNKCADVFHSIGVPLRKRFRRAPAASFLAFESLVQLMMINDNIVSMNEQTQHCYGCMFTFVKARLHDNRLDRDGAAIVSHVNNPSEQISIAVRR